MIMILTLVIILAFPASVTMACGRNNHHPRHHWFSRHHVERVVVAPVNDGSYDYYHNVLGKSKAWYLINIHKLP